MIDMENMFTLLDMEPGVQEEATAGPLQLVRGDVEYRAVSFGYELGSQVLQNVSFAARGGTTIAFVGATGSGKSTLTRLLLRFYDPCSGSVLVDGQDVRRVTLASLRAAVGVVPQDTVLFNDSIMHNIRYGRLGASDAEVHEAAEAAAIHQAITERFPKVGGGAVCASSAPCMWCLVLTCLPHPGVVCTYARHQQHLLLPPPSCSVHLTLPPHHPTLPPHPPAAGLRHGGG
jgi:ABC-type multidrug transport system fused ATPase/permease subunit